MSREAIGLDRGVLWAEAAAWAIAAALLALIVAATYGGPKIFHDSYQYLSIAENIAAGRGITTSVAHFDTERNHGVLPAPATWHPPGLPAVIAAVGRMTDLPLEQAALGVSVAAFSGIVLLLACGARQLAIGASGTRIVLCAFVLNAISMRFATSILAEALFAFVALAGFLLLIRGESASLSPRQEFVTACAAGVAFGALCWIRYAGLFMLVAAYAILGLRWARRPGRAAVAFGAVVVALSSISVAVLFHRNVALTGTWQGGNAKAVTNAAWPLVGDFATAIYELTTGLTPHRTVWGVIIFGCAAVAVIAAGRNAVRTGVAEVKRPAVGVLAAPIAVYVAGIIYMGLFSVITFGTRMFYPVLPLALLVLGTVMSAILQSTSPLKRPVAIGLLGIAGFVYVALNIRGIQYRHRAPHEFVQAALSHPYNGASSFRVWIESAVKRDSAVAATNGQATWYVLRRPTLSLVSRHYSTITWDEQELRTAMDRVGAACLITYPGLPAHVDPVQQESPILTQSISGISLPWLRMIGSNGQVSLHCRQ